VRTEIYIEGRKLDLTQDISSEFTYQIDDVRDFSSRQTNFSKTIVLPGTARNNKAFGFIFEFGTSNAYDPAEDNYGYNYNAAKSAQAVIYVDKVQIFKGALRLLEIIREGGTVEYECAIFGELGGLVATIANGKLTDLDFSVYDHEWNIANIQASWEYASAGPSGYMPASGYYYPLIDYGNVSYNSKANWDVKAFRPALYVREYLDKIITGAGYTWEGDFLNTSLFRRLIIPNNQKELYKIATNGIDAVRSSPYTILTDSVIFDILEYDAVSTADFSHTAGVFTYTGAGATLNLSLQLNALIYDNTGSDVVVRIRKNGSAFAEYQYPAGGLGSVSTIDIAYANAVTFATNDTLDVRLSTSGAKDPAFFVYVEAATLTASAGSTFIAPANYGDDILINQTIPKGVFQRDFLTSIVKMFNLYITEDTSRDKHIKIAPYINYYQTGADVLLDVDDFGTVFYVDEQDALLLEPGTTNFIDWTFKLDRSKPIRLRPMSELNARYFEYKFNTDNDYYNEQYFKKYEESYGDRLVDTGWEFGNEKQTAEVIFAPTPIVGYDTTSLRIPTIFKLTNTEGATPVEDRTEHVIRIMQGKKIACTQFDIKNGAGTTIASVSEYGYGGHLDDPTAPQTDINWGAPAEIYFTLSTPYPSANLFNGYWSEYIGEITDKDAKLLVGYFRLTEVDIYQLDFSRLIHIDGVLFRLNRIVDFNPTTQEVTKVELLRVINDV
jgi:hypothetical protein